LNAFELELEIFAVSYRHSAMWAQAVASMPTSIYII